MIYHLPIPTRVTKNKVLPLFKLTSIGCFLFMSYLIQNFSFNHYVVRASWKVRTLIVARNAFLIHWLLVNLSNPFILTASTWHFSTLYLTMSYHYFVRLFFVLFPTVKEIKHTPLGVNFPRSAYYTALVQVDATLTPFSIISPLLPITDRRILYPYPFGSPLILHASAKNVLFDFIYRFFRLSLTLWAHWPSSYKTWVHHTYLSPRLRTMWFLNRYYYKVYNI
jgi:hypothetical protein